MDRSGECWERDVFHSLVGTGFALWRSAFLCHAERTPQKLREEATSLLNLLLRDNAFTYPNERDTLDWMVGFYTNDARFRLKSAGEKLALNGGGDQNWVATIEQIEQLPDKPISNEQRNAEDLWEQLQATLTTAATALHDHLGVSPRQENRRSGG